MIAAESKKSGLNSARSLRFLEGGCKESLYQLSLGIWIIFVPIFYTDYFKLKKIKEVTRIQTMIYYKL